MQNEKVTIEVKSNKTVFPDIKYKKRNHCPMSNNYKFMPKSFAHLDAYACNLTWDSVSKTVTISIKETPDFDVVRWMEFLTEQHQELQKSPFVDIDQSALVIVFMDDQNNEIAKLGLKNLVVSGHTCTMFRHNPTMFGINNTYGELYHSITINYQYSQVVYGTNPLQPEPVGDKEWQEVEGP